MTPNTTSAIDLSRYDSAYQAARAETPSGNANQNTNTVPDGTYRVSVEDLTLGISPSSGNPILKWMFRILGPTQNRRVLYKVNGISERSMKILRQELETCGVTLERFGDLEKKLPAIIGLELEVAKKTRDDRSNIYINKLLSRKGALEPADDDLPF
jgi:hypothetical protein